MTNKIRDQINKLDETTLDSLKIFKDSVFQEIYHHVTKEVITEFDVRNLGESSCEDTVHGFCFYDLQTLMSAKESNFGIYLDDVIIKARLNVKRPIDLRTEKIFTDVTQASTIWQILSHKKVPGEKALKLLDRNIGLGEMGDLWDNINNEWAKQFILEAGYDGMITTMGTWRTQHVAFNTNQIQIISKEAIIKAYEKGTNKELIAEVNSLLGIKNENVPKMRL